MILFYHASSFFLIDSYFLIPAVIAKIFISAAEIVIPRGTQINEVNAEIEAQPVTVETKISKCSTFICCLIFFTH